MSDSGQTFKNIIVEVKTDFMNTLYKISFGLLVTGILFSCVPARKYQELKYKQDICLEEKEILKASNQDLEEKHNELNVTIEDLQKRMKALQSDTSVIGQSLRQMTKNYDQVNKTYQLLLDKNNELLAGNEAATKKLMVELQKAQESLQSQEDA